MKFFTTEEKGKDLDHVLTTYQRLVAGFAAAIIEHPDYPYRSEDKQRFFDSMTQSHLKHWKYECTMIEARRYADAFLESGA